MKDDLTERKKKGFFKEHGSADVLTVALETPEHPGRVRSMGANVGHKKYFKTPMKTTKYKEDLETQQFFMQQQIELEERLQAHYRGLEARLMERIDRFMQICQNQISQRPPLYQHQQFGAENPFFSSPPHPFPAQQFGGTPHPPFVSAHQFGAAPQAPHLTSFRPHPFNDGPHPNNTFPLQRPDVPYHTSFTQQQFNAPKNVVTTQPEALVSSPQRQRIPEEKLEKLFVSPPQQRQTVQKIQKTAQEQTTKERNNIVS